MNNDTSERLKMLRVPFGRHHISKLPKPYKKDSPKGNCKECGGYHGLPAVHLDYVGHAALTDRLLDVDPFWTWEPLATKDGLPLFDGTGGLWIRLTICGVTRLGYGNAENKAYMDIGAREKEVIGDALRNAAMRFGAALELWHKGDLHKEDSTENSDAKERLDGCQTIQELKETWESLTEEQRRSCGEVKDAMKLRLSSAQRGGLGHVKTDSQHRDSQPPSE